ncbi:septum formation initiator family protein [Roseivirga sp. BDSF3-8]|uniref:FtsB family cell division protein n=1 Tax=Roseivirga sp. BDSF3-8 TaxID=3241598 RepID=UPI003531B36A
MLNRIPPIAKNFYLIVGSIFLAWMLFFDTNDLITQWQMTSRLNDLEREKAFYLQKIEEVKKDQKELMTDKKLLEKFAREKYYMKKESEDVYILVEE